MKICSFVSRTLPQSTYGDSKLQFIIKNVDTTGRLNILICITPIVKWQQNSIHLCCCESNIFHMNTILQFIQENNIYNSNKLRNCFLISSVSPDVVIPFAVSKAL